MYNFPKDADYLFFVWKLDDDFGGLTKAMLQRAKLFSEYNQDLKIKIFTFGFNPNFEYTSALVRDQYKLNNNVQILNIYDFLQQKHTSEQLMIGENYHIADDCFSIEKVKNKAAYRYYKNGLYVMYKSFETKNGKLKFIDFFNENRYRIRREEFDVNGVLRKKTYFDYFTNKPKQELYYSNNNLCYLSKWYKLENEQNKIDRIVLFDKDDEITNIFNSIHEFRLHWTKKMINTSNKNFAICDARPIDNIVLSLEEQNIYKIFVTHSIHLRPPFDYDSELRSGNRAVINNIRKPDAIVFLTKAQKLDVIKRCGDTNNLYVIPHSYNDAVVQPNFKEKDLNKVVLLARYHKEKQVDHAIKAFSEVVKKIPDAKMELYGFGVEETNFKIMIKELNLEHNVFVSGITNTPAKVFRENGISLLTSKYEGFGLVILESLANGTPVIAYNIKYGPDDMIIHDHNGLLVEPNNINQLSKAIIKLLSNKQHLKEMSLNAANSIGSFYPEAFLKNWSILLNDIIRKNQYKNKINQMDFHLNRSEWYDIATGVYKLSGIMELKGEYLEETLNDLKLMIKVSDIDSERVIFEEVNHLNRVSKLKWEVSHTISLNTIYKGSHLPKGNWDVSIIMKWNNSYFEKKVGYSKSKNIKVKNTKPLLFKTVALQPIYTEEYGNLIFSVTKK